MSLPPPDILSPVPRKEKWYTPPIVLTLLVAAWLGLRWYRAAERAEPAIQKALAHMESEHGWSRNPLMVVPAPTAHKLEHNYYLVQGRVGLCPAPGEEPGQWTDWHAEVRHEADRGWQIWSSGVGPLPERWKKLLR